MGVLSLGGRAASAEEGVGAEEVRRSCFVLEPPGAFAFALKRGHAALAALKTRYREADRGRWFFPQFALVCERRARRAVSAMVCRAGLATSAWLSRPPLGLRVPVWAAGGPQRVLFRRPVNCRLHVRLQLPSRGRGGSTPQDCPNTAICARLINAAQPARAQPSPPQNAAHPPQILNSPSRTSACRRRRHRHRRRHRRRHRHHHPRPPQTPGSAPSQRPRTRARAG